MVPPRRRPRRPLGLTDRGPVGDHDITTRAQDGLGTAAGNPSPPTVAPTTADWCRPATRARPRDGGGARVRAGGAQQQAAAVEGSAAAVLPAVVSAAGVPQQPPVEAAGSTSAALLPSSSGWASASTT